MSIVKDFRKIDIGLKVGVLTVLFQMPFFFISLYLFKKTLIERIATAAFSDIDFYFLLCLCFCFSLTWFFMNVALAFIVIDLADNLTESTSDNHEKYMVTMTQSIAYLSCAIVLSYYFNLTFNLFLFWAYSYMVFRIFWVIVGQAINWFRNRNN